MREFAVVEVSATNVSYAAFDKIGCLEQAADCFEQIERIFRGIENDQVTCDLVRQH